MSANIETLNEEVNKKVPMKSYRHSFFYNQSGKSGENLMKKHDQMLMNFIMKADRLDKNSDMFRGVAEDVKRQQTTSILYTILMMDDVHLCTANTELPPAITFDTTLSTLLYAILSPLSVYGIVYGYYYKQLVAICQTLFLRILCLKCKICKKRNKRFYKS